MQEETYILINKLLFKEPSHKGECGITDDKLYFPLFRMGCCGDERGVYTSLTFNIPKKMDYKWFKSIADMIKRVPFWDWDWSSFEQNILEPNRYHLKKTLKIDDAKVDRLLRDGFVFMNHFEEYPEYDKYPNFKNFLEKPLGSLDY